MTLESVLGLIGIAIASIMLAYGIALDVRSFWYWAVMVAVTMAGISFWALGDAPWEPDQPVPTEQPAPRRPSVEPTLPQLCVKRKCYARIPDHAIKMVHDWEQEVSGYGKV